MSIIVTHARKEIVERSGKYVKLGTMGSKGFGPFATNATSIQLAAQMAFMNTSTSRSDRFYQGYSIPLSQLATYLVV